MAIKWLLLLSVVNRNYLQCFDAVGWAKEGHPTCKKLGVSLSVVMI